MAKFIASISFDKEKFAKDKETTSLRGTASLTRLGPG
jgi:hypothetical protein